MARRGRKGGIYTPRGPYNIFIYIRTVMISPMTAYAFDSQRFFRPHSRRTKKGTSVMLLNLILTREVLVSLYVLLFISAYCIPSDMYYDRIFEFVRIWSDRELLLGSRSRSF